jgi:hypothetical protein
MIISVLTQGNGFLGFKQFDPEAFGLPAQPLRKLNPGMLSSFSVPAACPPNAACSMTSVSIASLAVYNAAVKPAGPPPSTI